MAQKESNSSTNSFYSLYENLKNRNYRELSGTRVKSAFWPSYYYHWFYSVEQVNYTNLIKRQHLGNKISQEDIDEYNQIRSKISPKSSYEISKFEDKTFENEVYDNIYLKRKNCYFKHCFALSLFSYYYLQLTRWWFLFSFTPIAILTYTDKKFSPKEELNNFYNFLNEKRESSKVYEENKVVFENKLNNLQNLKNNINNFENNDLNQIMNELYTSYLKNAGLM